MRDALAELPYDFVAALLVGGTEKLRGGDDYGVPLVESLEGGYDVVVDLSDEPVLGPRERFRWVSRALALGLPYVGADFRFDPPAREPFALPSIAVIGTGKRVGKTAVTGHVARLFAGDRKVVVVAMGRGGPREPVLVEEPPDAARLVELSRAGEHAASDYLETAALAGVVTVGCRRCGGGLAGAVATSNVAAGAALAAAQSPDLVVFDGSGAAIPPVATTKTVLVADARAGLDYLNAYRAAIADLVVATMAEDGIGELAELDRPVVPVTLRLRPVTPVAGRRVAVFTTGAGPVDHLDADVVAVSRNLANRPALREDLAGIDADVYVVELKAAAIDVVAEAALERGVELVLADNEVVSLDALLDDELRKLV